MESNEKDTLSLTLPGVSMDIGGTMVQVTPVRPTLMKEWLRCPYRATLRGLGWRAPLDWQRDPLLWIGQSIHSAMAAHFQRGSPDTSFAHTLDEYWQEPPVEAPWPRHRASRVGLGLATLAMVRFDPCVDSVVAVEYETGFGKPDLVYVHKAGDVRVVDWKFHRRTPREMQAYDTDWQMWHYAWLCRYKGWGTPSMVEVVNLIAEPKLDIIVHEIPITTERLDQWASEASVLWDQFSHRSPFDRRGWSGCDVPFYPCEFKPVCHWGIRLEDGFRKDEGSQKVVDNENDRV